MLLEGRYSIVCNGSNWKWPAFSILRMLAKWIVVRYNQRIAFCYHRTHTTGNGELLPGRCEEKTLKHSTLWTGMMCSQCTESRGQGLSLTFNKSL